MIIKHNGIVYLERPDNQADEAFMAVLNDGRYGAGNWKWCERVCSYLTPECGYGEKHDKSTCRYCDGTCIRPLEKPAPQRHFHECSNVADHPYTSTCIPALREHLQSTTSMDACEIENTLQRADDLLTSDFCSGVDYIEDLLAADLDDDDAEEIEVLDVVDDTDEDYADNLFIDGDEEEPAKLVGDETVDEPEYEELEDPLPHYATGHYPCDGEDCHCPFDATNSMSCRNYCGLGL